MFKNGVPGDHPDLLPHLGKGIGLEIIRYHKAAQLMEKDNSINYWSYLMPLFYIICGMAIYDIFMHGSMQLFNPVPVLPPTLYDDILALCERLLDNMTLILPTGLALYFIIFLCVIIKNYILQ